MKKILILTVLSIALLLTSCMSSNDTNHNSLTNQSDYGIKLLNNQKWQVNEEMMVHIKNIESDIQSTSSQTDPNYEDLGLRLDKNIGLLISNCTMKGQAHDELHKWLLPFIDLVKELNTTDSNEKQKQSFEAIQESMNVFNTYFE